MAGLIKNGRRFCNENGVKTRTTSNDLETEKEVSKSLLE